MAQASTDAPRDLAGMFRWRRDKEAWVCDDHYLVKLNAKWRQIGRLAKGPASLRNAENHN